MAEKTQKKAAEAAQEPLTMAQELRAMMDGQDADNPGQTLRQTLCQAALRQAAEGSFKHLEWIFHVSGEQAREEHRLFELDKIENPQKHLFDNLF